MSPATDHFYHYTVGIKLAGIIKADALMPAGVSAAPWEKPVLWFSRNPKWEPTATKILIANGQTFRPSVAELHERAGLYRFVAANPRIYAWQIINRKAGVRLGDIKQMEKLGRKLGALPSDWFGTLAVMPLTELDFERFNGQCWEPADLQEEADHWAALSKNVLQAKATEIGL